MNRVERLTGILMLLQQGPRTAQQLADRYEVSRRTILRDLDGLAQIGVPVVATPGRSGGYRVQGGHWLQPLQLNLDETVAVLFALECAEDADGDTPLGRAHRTAREKIESSMKSELHAAARTTLRAIEIARPHIATDPGTTRILLDAIANERWLRLVYKSGGNETSRTILPRLLTVSDGKWYVHAVDALRSAMRLFRLDRIVDVRHAAAPPDAQEILALAQSGGVAYDDPANPEVVIELTDVGVDLALDHPDFHHWVTIGDHLASLRFRCPVHELPYYCREIVRFGTGARIISPDEFRTMVVDHAASIARHHDAAFGDNAQANLPKR